jgi:hypothetical protein
MSSAAFWTAFRAKLTAELSDAGWDRFPFADPDRLTFTYELGKGFQAVIEVTALGHPGPPMPVEADTGVAYARATALMPRLTLPPSPILVLTGDPDTEASRAATEPDSESDLDRFRADVLQLARDKAVRLARPFATVDELEASLRADVEDCPEAVIETLPVFLAATGRESEALTLVEEFLASDLDEVQDRDYRRFARQLRLWVDAGSPVPPALEAWPVDAFASPPTGEPDEPRRARRNERDATRDAVDAVRRRAGGKSRSELVALLSAEYSRRGLDVAPAAVVMQAGLLEVERGPFGKLRSGLMAFRTATALTREAVTGLRHAFEDGPSWLEPPDEALFDVPSDGGWVPVAIADDAEEWLARVAAASHATPQLLTHCEAWLRPADVSEGATAGISVFIGHQRVGRLQGSDVEPFRPAMAAAACYADLPVVRAQLLWSTDPGERSLALARPSSVPRPPPF